MDESESNNDWITDFYQERIDFSWLDYNPHVFLPLDFDYFFRSGKINTITVPTQDRPDDFRPCFIVGCGRSGTTVLSKILSAHPDICFLNEPRELWMQAFPSFDVWSSMSRERQGKLRMSRADASPEGAHKLNDLFYAVTRMVNRKQLLEKTPENTFRLKWLNELFPGCKFIMVKRNPIGTARSIARFQPDTWYGFDSYKWEQLSKLIPRYKKTLGLSDEFINLTNESVFAKALIEWALSVLSAEEFKASLPKETQNDRFIEVHLEQIISSPHESMKEILEFLGLSESTAVYDMSSELLQRHLTPTSSMASAQINGSSNEEHILSQAGASLRNLIFEHSLHN